jgi:hypothetical protein
LSYPFPLECLSHISGVFDGDGEYKCEVVSSDSAWKLDSELLGIALDIESKSRPNEVFSDKNRKEKLMRWRAIKNNWNECAGGRFKSWKILFWGSLELV